MAPLEGTPQEPASEECGRLVGDEGSAGTPAPRWGSVARRAVQAAALLTLTVAAATIFASPARGDRGRVAVPPAVEEGLIEEYTEYPSMPSNDELGNEANGVPGMPFLDMEAPRTAGPASPTERPGAIDDDGNTMGAITCGGNEELFLGLCYKKCQQLTSRKYPHRVAPNVCCEEFSFKCLLPSKVSVSLDNAVGGDGNHPHPPGACDGNEEQSLGLCYKKCSILTNNEFNIRVAAGTCCKERPCYNPLNLHTVAGRCSGFAVGGGYAGHECPHAPVTGNKPSAGPTVIPQNAYTPPAPPPVPTVAPAVVP